MEEVKNHSTVRAPVLISVYNRLYTLRRCIMALQENGEALETDLYIVSDAAGRGCDVDKVQEIREYVKTISGFKSVSLIARPENWGSNRSICTAIEDLLKERGELIFMEDDILPGKCYLSYMNQALHAYADDPNVFAVCGYKSNFKLPTSYGYDLFALNRYSPWGVGFWQHKYAKLNSGTFDRYSMLQRERPELFALLKRSDPQFVSLLESESKGGLKALDVCIEWHLFMTNQVCIYPRQSMTMVMDSGNDAEHCTTRWSADEPLSKDCPKDYGSSPLAVDDEIYRRFLSAKYPGLCQRFAYAVKHQDPVWVFRYYFGRIIGRLKK